ncbi:MULTISPECIES: 30S ribosomal protein S8 [Halorhodospira]|uniref:Small ribosomal subunit protein uS8 n=1 Tax=Halorhodospira halophila (strain DSM 244 / SL1) TaxID=349124 RepID=RS8_HALHL|nr:MULTISPECIES: 30S ribosomal protein S8 [Halorhodospira]A1WVA8.1 RecName: Full=Small ribosomal subunit protein uS8; AltName: Full=30S ribosomal protein S8 [Halorhodospira halophila SL1]ABM61620.1 SSU ribosomal protein S8P [Halorhodospira halophila SL1]MBK1729922.1 30S ribosomal protein S8 [Halorhodospira halophila]MBK5935596.1 30S ribosomal protein S8 [Halorhodospira halophila]MBK5943110.1 30S ribosomal protein S8 [Halorhodospira halophila]MCC3750877.1 30S ribosomal protein S8 [Halorhodospi
MSMTDPIADMLTRVRNAHHAEKADVRMPSSKLKRAIAAVLQEEGYIEGYREVGEEKKPVLEVTLRYHEGQPAIREIQRYSRPGLRVYRGRDELPRVRNGLGTAIISTSKGVMSDGQARAQGHGGEVLCWVF